MYSVTNTSIVTSISPKAGFWTPRISSASPSLLKSLARFGSLTPSIDVGCPQPVISSSAVQPQKRTVGIIEIEGGFPHSEILGSKPVRGSPRLIAAYHVLHRLSAPRHPPNALMTLDCSHYRRPPFCNPSAEDAHSFCHPPS